MGILNILYRTGVQLARSLIQVVGVLILGVHELSGKLGEYLAKADKWLYSRIGKFNKKKEKTTRIDFTT